MITEELIRGEFMHQIMSRDSRFIYDTQARVLRENFTGERIENMASYLSKHPVQMEGGGTVKTYYFSVMTYLRLLDIRSSRGEMGLRRRLALYNRVIWGRLYNETRNNLRYGMSEDIRKGITKQLEEMDPSKV